MNQSKHACCIAIFSCLAVFICFLSFIHSPSCIAHPIIPADNAMSEPMVRYAGVSYDAGNYYAPIIAGHKSVTDWHSALYMYECRALNHLLRLAGFSCDGVLTQIVFYYVNLSVVLLLWGVALFCAVRRHLIISLMVVPIGISVYFLLEWLKLGLDFFFFVQVLICLFFLISVPKLKKKMRLFAWALVIISLFHAVNYRKNAILLIPLVTSCLFVYSHSICENKYRMLFKWLVITIAFVIISWKGVSCCLPVEHREPIVPMLSSDLRIAAVLRGEQEELRRELKSIGAREALYLHPFKNSLSSRYGGELGDKGKLLDGGSELYANHWRRYTGSMLSARFLQIVEFYCGGSIPHGHDLIRKVYPAVADNPAAFTFVMQISPTLMYARFSILVVGLVLCLALLYRRIKGRNPLTPYDDGIMLSCSFALIYAGSFAVMPPTADLRYLATSLFLIWNAFWVFAALWIEKRIKQSSEQNTI